MFIPARHEANQVNIKGRLALLSNGELKQQNILFEKNLLNFLLIRYLNKKLIDLFIREDTLYLFDLK